MRSTLGGVVFVALLVAACGSTPPATPPADTPAPSAWDPRADAIDQHAAIWARHQPAAYEYDLDTTGQGPAAYHVSGVEGATQVQHLSGPVLPDADQASVTVEGLFQRARSALSDPSFKVEFNDLLGNPTKLTFGSGEVDSVDNFRTSTTQGGVAKAQASLQAVLQRWHAVDAPRWAYTWTRTPAAASSQPVAWSVSHVKGDTRAKPVGAGDGSVTSDDVSIDGTVSAVQNVLVSGGWADVAIEDDPGLGVLIAVDPKPGIKGDGYFIRIAVTDLARQASISALDAAKARWATAQLTDYSYTWSYSGDGTPLSYKVTRRAGTSSVARLGATPVAQPAYGTPLVEDTFTMIDAVLAQGGSVDATYDDQLGYPTRVEMHPAGGSGATGVVTIKGFKHS